MKRKFISLMMVGMLATSMNMMAFANATTPTTPPTTDATTSATTKVQPAPVVQPAPKAQPTATEGAKDLSEYKALNNKLETLKKQAEGAKERIQKANSKDKKSLENSTAAYEKQIKALQEKIKELLKEKDDEDRDGKDDDQKYTDKQKEYIDSIESALKKDNPQMIMVTSDQIVTDNPAFKTDMPLAVKNGVVYMAKSTIESSFGVALKYEEQQKKFISKVDGVLLEIFLTQNYIELDGIAKNVVAKPITIKDKVYFPLNGIDKLFKVEVKWDKDLKVVSIDDLDIPNVPTVPTTPVVPAVPVTPAPTTPVTPTTNNN